MTQNINIKTDFKMNTWKYSFDLVGARGLMDSELGIVLYSPSEKLEYVEMVKICHDLVESYLDEHPEIKYGTKGYRYYDILKMVSPEYDEKVRAWSLEHKRRKEEYYDKVKDWGRKYLGMEAKDEE